MSIVSPDVGLIDMPGNVIQATELERHYRIDQRAFYFDLEVTHFAYISTDLLQLSWKLAKCIKFIGYTRVRQR